MSALSERLDDADLDTIARVLHAVRARRAEREKQERLESSTDTGESRTVGAA